MQAEQGLTLMEPLFWAAEEARERGEEPERAAPHAPPRVRREFQPDHSWGSDPMGDGVRKGHAVGGQARHRPLAAVPEAGME